MVPVHCRGRTCQGPYGAVLREIKTGAPGPVMIESGPSQPRFDALPTSPLLSEGMRFHFMDTTEIPLPTVETAPPPAGQRSYFRDVPWKWSDVLICFAPDLAGLVGAALGFRPVLRAPRWFFLPSIVLFELWMLVCPLWIARKRLGAWPRLPTVRPVLREARWLVLLVPIVFCAMIATHFAIVAVFGEDSVSPNGWEPIARAANQGERIGIALLGILLAPLGEEFFFRGMLYNKLRQSLPIAVAAVLQGALFGLLHPFGLSQSFIIAGIGLALALVYEWRKTLVAPVLLHSSINGVVTVLFALNIAAAEAGPRLGVLGEPQNGGVVLREVVPVSAADLAGLRAGDVVTAMDGFPVPDMLQMRRIVRSKRVGDKVTVDFVRDGKTQQVEVTFTPLPK
jgi:membrane protease YdiL (CAAX protease family)